MVDLSGYENIIFDFDGVIIDSNFIKLKGFEKLFRKYLDLEPEEIEIYRESDASKMGVNRFDKFTWIYENFKKLRTKSLENFIKDCNFTYTNIVGDDLKAVNIAPMFGEFRSYESKFFIVSASYQKDVEDLVKYHGLNKFFGKDDIYGSPKSKYDNISQLLRINNIQSSNAVLIGDSYSDMLVAERFSMRPVFVQDWSAENADLKNYLRNKYDCVNNLSHCIIR